MEKVCRGTVKDTILWDGQIFLLAQKIGRQVKYVSACKEYTSIDVVRLLLEDCRRYGVYWSTVKRVNVVSLLIHACTCWTSCGFYLKVQERDGYELAENFLKYMQYSSITRMQCVNCAEWHLGKNWSDSHEAIRYTWKKFSRLQGDSKNMSWWTVKQFTSVKAGCTGFYWIIKMLMIDASYLTPRAEGIQDGSGKLTHKRGTSANFYSINWYGE
jgi:hypothetical protein